MAVCRSRLYLFIILRILFVFPVAAYSCSRLPLIVLPLVFLLWHRLPLIRVPVCRSSFAASRIIINLLIKSVSGTVCHSFVPPVCRSSSAAGFLSLRFLEILMSPQVARGHIIILSNLNNLKPAVTLGTRRVSGPHVHYELLAVDVRAVELLYRVGRFLSFFLVIKRLPIQQTKTEGGMMG